MRSLQFHIYRYTLEDVAKDVTKANIGLAMKDAPAGKGAATMAQLSLSSTKRCINNLLSSCMASFIFFRAISSINLWVGVAVPGFLVTDAADAFDA